MADDRQAEVTDLECLCAFWNVNQEEAIRRSAHLTRELIDHDQAGGEVVLRWDWERGLFGIKKSRRVERIRFRGPFKEGVAG